MASLSEDVVERGSDLVDLLIGGSRSLEFAENEDRQLTDLR